MTGPNATWGQSEANAVKMAVEKVNAHGVVLGRKLEIVAYDNRADRLEAVNVAKRLVEQDKVVAIIGPAQSGVTNAIREVNNSAILGQVDTPVRLHVLGGALSVSFKHQGDAFEELR